MRDKLRKLLRMGFKIFLAGTAFMILFTVYCLLAVPDLCNLAKENPKTTAFQEMRKKEWEEKKLNRKLVKYWVPLSSISRHLKNAVLSAEDPNFYHHHGIDFEQTWIAFQEDLQKFKIASGASGLTQQLMKNLYLSPSQNPFRKWKEAILALRVERCVKKDRLLEIYLNEIEWGEATYGAEAAARKYFGKSASALDPAEAALLAAMIPNPVLYNPYTSGPHLFRKKNTILKLMNRGGLLSGADYNAAVNERIRLR